MQIQIKDQGIGMKDPSSIGHMFKRLEVKDNVNQNGIGFGLTISKMIMEGLGGTLSLKNNIKVAPSAVSFPNEETPCGLSVTIRFPDI